MAKKITKGYYVKGQFVAEGSELDIELKKELKGTDTQSRTDLKKESLALQKMGEDLLTLGQVLMDRLDLSDKLKDAVLEARRITNFEGKRRQMQFIGKLMRLLDDAQLDAIRDALKEQHSGSIADIAALHAAQAWRDRLIADDDALQQWITQSPTTDSQQLRALIRQARKDARPEKPGQAPRHGRAFREIFQLVKNQLSPDNKTLDDETDQPAYKP